MTTDTVLADCPYKDECDAKGEHVALGCPDIRADRARKWGKLKGVPVFQSGVGGRVMIGVAGVAESGSWHYPIPSEGQPAQAFHPVPDPATAEGMVAWMEALAQVIFTDIAIDARDKLWFVTVSADGSKSYDGTGPTLLAAFANAVDKLEVGT